MAKRSHKKKKQSLETKDLPESLGSIDRSSFCFLQNSILEDLSPHLTDAVIGTCAGADGGMPSDEKRLRQRKCL